MSYVFEASIAALCNDAYWRGTQKGTEDALAKIHTALGLTP